MAIAKLKTNFQDDIINTLVNEDRQFEMIQNTNGTVSLKDVTVYDQTGSNYGAMEINKSNDTINQLIDHTSNIENTSDSEKRVKYAETAGTAESSEAAKSCDNDFILCNQAQLTFEGNSCTINDSRITANSLADVYFSSDSIGEAEEAVVSVETFLGMVTLSSVRTVTGTLTATIRIRVVE